MAGALGVVITTDVPVSGQHAQPVYVDDTLPIVGPSRAIVVTNGDVPQMGGPPLAVRLAPAGTPATGPALPVYVVSGSLGRSSLVAPDQISGLQLWYKADAITGLNDGDSLTTWTDLGALGKNITQATASKKPLYKIGIVNGLPVVRFDGTDDYLASATTFTAIAQPYTVFCVVQSNNASKDRYFDSTNRPLFGNDTTGYELYAGSAVLTGSTRNTAWHIFTIVFNGASSVARRDGTSIITGNPGAQSIGNTLYVGGDAIGPGADPLSGDIAEFGVYSGALSITDHNNVGIGLAAKYGLTWNSF